jgi:hypothetical protein
MKRDKNSRLFSKLFDTINAYGSEISYNQLIRKARFQNADTPTEEACTGPDNKCDPDTKKDQDPPVFY